MNTAQPVDGAASALHVPPCWPTNCGALGPDPDMSRWANQQVPLGESDATVAAWLLMAKLTVLPSEAVVGPATQAR